MKARKKVGFNPLDNVFEAIKKDKVINWIPIQGFKLKNNNPDKMRANIGIEANGKKRLYIRIGNKIVEKLGWEEKDRILLMYDADDVCLSRMIKHETGYKLQATKNTFGKTSIYHIQIPAEHLPFDNERSTDQKFQIMDDDSLMFRLEF